MKVKLIHTFHYVLDEITIGKIYDVIEYENCYSMRNNFGKMSTYNKGMFEDVSISRDKKLKELGI